VRQPLSSPSRADAEVFVRLRPTKLPWEDAGPELVAVLVRMHKYLLEVRAEPRQPIPKLVRYGERRGLHKI